VSTAAGAAFARLGELELYYETQGTGPPLVLIHGSLMTAGLMNDYPALLAAGRRVITVELQGHGHTRDTGLCDRAEWVVPMIAEFLGDAGG
jgi:pimeloyl-ACP methyl ester carboxylesterase